MTNMFFKIRQILNYFTHIFGISIACLRSFILFNGDYLSICVKQGLVFGITKQMSDGKELSIYLKINPSKIMLTSLSSVDMLFWG